LAHSRRMQKERGIEAAKTIKSRKPKRKGSRSCGRRIGAPVRKENSNKGAESFKKTEGKREVGTASALRKEEIRLNSGSKQARPFEKEKGDDT